MAEIQYDDFAKLDIRSGTVVAAEVIPETDKLIKCTIDFGLKPSAPTEGSADHSSAANGLGEKDIRTIVSGIAQWKKPEDLIGKQFPYIVNLAPRTLRGVESQGMLLAASDEEGVALIFPERSVQNGTRLK
jgi:methionyl-tRNA synthetase